MAVDNQGSEEEQLFNLSGVLKKVLYKNDETKYIIAVLENNQKNMWCIF